MFVDDIGKSTRSPAVRRNSQDVVGQPLHQLAPGRIGDQSAEAAQLASLAAGRVGKRLTQQRVGQRNRLFDSHRVILHPITGDHFIHSRVHHVQVIPNVLAR